MSAQVSKFATDRYDDDFSPKKILGESRLKIVSFEKKS